MAWEAQGGEAARAQTLGLRANAPVGWKPACWSPCGVPRLELMCGQKGRGWPGKPATGGGCWGAEPRDRTSPRGCVKHKGRDGLSRVGDGGCGEHTSKTWRKLLCSPQPRGLTGRRANTQGGRRGPRGRAGHLPPRAAGLRRGCGARGAPGAAGPTAARRLCASEAAGQRLANVPGPDRLPPAPGSRAVIARQGHVSEASRRTASWGGAGASLPGCWPSPRHRPPACTGLGPAPTVAG